MTKAPTNNNPPVYTLGNPLTFSVNEINDIPYQLNMTKGLN